MKLREFFKSENGAALVEYAVALVVVTIVGAVIFALGDNIAIIMGTSAGAF